MTNIWVRIKRDNGDFDNVEIDDMTDSELDRFITNQREVAKNDGWNWMKVLAVWIRDNVRVQP